MIKARCEKCGAVIAPGEEHKCPEPPPGPPGNDNPAPEPPGHFDEKAWRKAYMRRYMREWRARRHKGRQPEDIAS